MKREHCSICQAGETTTEPKGIHKVAAGINMIAMCDDCYRTIELNIRRNKFGHLMRGNDLICDPKCPQCEKYHRCDQCKPKKGKEREYE